MDIDISKQNAILACYLIDGMDMKSCPQSTADAMLSLRRTLMEKVLLITLIQDLRRKHPAAAFEIELFLQGVED